jgi:hypothetical protein
MTLGSSTMLIERATTSNHLGIAPARYRPLAR